MSEYIVDVGDADELHFAAFQKKAEFCFGYPVREEVVRCKNCKESLEFGNICTRFDYMDVEPDGCCSWGIKR